MKLLNPQKKPQKSSPTQNIDHLVVGGGIAGSTLAFHLAQKGLSVHLIEKSSKAHHKVCGEFLRGESGTFLEEMGISLVKLGASMITQCDLFTKDNFVSFRLPQKGYGLSRHLLDQVLLERTAEVGVKVIRGKRVTRIETSSSRTSSQVISGNTCYLPRHLFLAIGKHDLGSFQVRPNLFSPMMGFKMHYQLSKKSLENLKGRIKFFLFKGGYGGLSLVENEIANFCFIIKESIFKKLGADQEGLFDFLFHHYPFLRKEMKEAIPLFKKPLCIARIPYGFLWKKSFSSPSSFIHYVGDQLCVIPSFTGNGMTLAFWGGREMAMHFSKNQNLPSNLFSKKLKPPLWTSLPFHLLSQYSLPAKLMIQTLKKFPSLPPVIFQLTRMPRSLYPLPKISEGKP